MYIYTHTDTSISIHSCRYLFTHVEHVAALAASSARIRKVGSLYGPPPPLSPCILSIAIRRSVSLYMVYMG